MDTIRAKPTNVAYREAWVRVFKPKPKPKANPKRKLG
jgi:hypothetical protein